MRIFWFCLSRFLAEATLAMVLSFGLLGGGGWCVCWWVGGLFEGFIVFLGCFVKIRRVTGALKKSKRVYDDSGVMVLARKAVSRPESSATLTVVPSKAVMVPFPLFLVAHRAPRVIQFCRWGACRGVSHAIVAEFIDEA